MHPPRRGQQQRVDGVEVRIRLAKRRVAQPEQRVARDERRLQVGAELDLEAKEVAHAALAIGARQLTARGQPLVVRKQRIGVVRGRPFAEPAGEGEAVGAEAQHVGPVVLLEQLGHARHAALEQAVVVAEQQHVVARRGTERGEPVLGHRQRLGLAHDLHPRIAREALQHVDRDLVARVVGDDELEIGVGLREHRPDAVLELEAAVARGKQDRELHDAPSLRKTAVYVLPRNPRRSTGASASASSAPA